MKRVVRVLSLAFSGHPLSERSPEAAAKRYCFTHFNRSLSEEERDRYMAASRDVDDLDKYIDPSRISR